MQATDPITVVEQFSAALAARDVATLVSLYADDVVVWHNTYGCEEQESWAWPPTTQAQRRARVASKPSRRF